MKKTIFPFPPVLANVRILPPSISLSFCPRAVSHLYSHRFLPVTSHLQTSCVGTVCNTSRVCPWLHSAEIFRLCHWHAINSHSSFRMAAHFTRFRNRSLYAPLAACVCHTSMYASTYVCRMHVNVRCNWNALMRVFNYSHKKTMLYWAWYEPNQWSFCYWQ